MKVGEAVNLYLNTDTALENYKQLIRITKPRRFGKSSIINMIGAYYTKQFDSKDIFDNLNISKNDGYLDNINKYNVINISFSKIPKNMKSYEDYISKHKE